MLTLDRPTLGTRIIQFRFSLRQLEQFHPLIRSMHLLCIRIHLEQIPDIFYAAAVLYLLQILDIVDLFCTLLLSDTFLIHEILFPVL